MKNVFGSCIHKFSTLDLANHIGEIFIYAPIPTVQSIKPKTREASRVGSLSYRFGLSSFPLHTDMAHLDLPPRYILLRAINPSNEVKTTITKFEESTIKLTSSILKPKVKNLKRLFCIEERHSSQSIRRWDESMFVPYSTNAKKFCEWLKKCKMHEVELVNSGDFIIIDNWSCLHGRTNVNHKSINRKLERVYLKELKNEWKSRVVL